MSAPETPPAWVDETALDLARTIQRLVHGNEFKDRRTTARIQCAMVDIIMRERSLYIPRP